MTYLVFFDKIFLNCFPRTQIIIMYLVSSYEQLLFLLFENRVHQHHTNNSRNQTIDVLWLIAERFEEARPEPGGVRGPTRSRRVTQTGGPNASKPPPSSRRPHGGRQIAVFECV